jgi:hypothetical protein
MKTPAQSQINLGEMGNNEQLKQLLADSPAYLSNSLIKPVRLNGDDYSFVVLPIKLTPGGKVESVCDDLVFCQTESEMKETAAQLVETAKINVAAIQAAGWSTVSFTTNQVLSNGERSIACDKSGQICFVRYKWQHRPPKKAGLSKEDAIVVGHIPSIGVTGVGVVTEMRDGQLVEVLHFAKPKIVKELGCNCFYKAFVYCGEKCDRNMDETFFFVAMPPQVASGASVDETLKVLLNFVRALLREERRRDETRAVALQQEQLKSRPAHLPHESSGIDHYKNQQQVVEGLLRKEWPLLFAAMDKTKEAKTAVEKAECKRRIWLAYIADQKAMFGKMPDVRSEEAAELWKDDEFLGLMNQAMNDPRQVLDKRALRLAVNWIVKNYYRMNEKALEEAFNRDWNCPPGFHKGNTLAKLARSIGLLFALSKGRPEKGPNLLPPG